MKLYIGIDNGVSGSIGIIRGDGVALRFLQMPTKKQQDYHKKKSNITRVDTVLLKSLLSPYVDDFNAEIIIGMENPMVNPHRWKASVSALRAFEATLTVIESLKVPYHHILSKDWQKEFFPKKFTSGDSKKLSVQKGQQFFPSINIGKHPDYDGLLIAEYLKRKY